MASDSQTIKTKISREKISKLLMENNLQSRVLYPTNLPIKYGGRTHFQTCTLSRLHPMFSVLRITGGHILHMVNKRYSEQAFNTRGREG